MKHRRGIEFGEFQQRSHYPIAGYPLDETFESLEGWYLLGAQCGRCKRQAVLDRRELARRWGGRTVIASLVSRLRCTGHGCGNRRDNLFWLAKLPR